MIKCLSPYCKTVITNSNASKIEHIKRIHPNFYQLIQDSLERGEQINYNKFFSEAF